MKENTATYLWHDISSYLSACGAILTSKLTKNCELFVSTWSAPIKQSQFSCAASHLGELKCIAICIESRLSTWFSGHDTVVQPGHNSAGRSFTTILTCFFSFLEEMHGNNDVAVVIIERKVLEQCKRGHRREDADMVTMVKKLSSVVESSIATCEHLTVLQKRPAASLLISGRQIHQLTRLFGRPRLRKLNVEAIF
ncbi:unnamed protein product [Peronospora belbahrii]|uniref:Uncharacterized protein n=1 Tax=Peronospora belbahrii TaxID=622444 RepID=A0ABN8D1H8_9STRA|nr:unnamed protein product [Peronospora belbahrii]